MSKADILSFLRDPTSFLKNPTRSDIWRKALTDVAQPAMAAKSTRTLRPAQVKAWQTIADQRLGLILGPPGTGKTFTLSWMALAYLEACRREGIPCRVMVTAFTRNAAANVLEAIAEKAREILDVKVPIYFAGRAPDKGVAEGVHGLKDKQFANAMKDEHLVVGCTTWTLYKYLEKGLHGGKKGSRVAELFDLVCIDEASQLQVPQGLMGLAGLREGGRVLVAGDNKQLAPIGGGYDWEIDDRSLGGSVYDFLENAGVPECRLSETFRLNQPLSSFPSEHFYDGDYTSAKAVKHRRLTLRDEWQAGLEQIPWQRIALDPDYPVVVLLHDGPAAGTRNQDEVAIVRQLVEALGPRVTPWKDEPVVRPASFWNHQLAVVSPHRAQNVALRNAMHEAGHGDSCVVETVDRIQGRERDSIIMSYTVSDPEFAMVEAAFLFSVQRFNVALTRARSKFIMVLSRALLEVVPTQEEVFDQARLLREFVFECQEAGTVTVAGHNGRGLEVSIRLRGFHENTPLPTDLLEPLPETTPKIPLPVLTKELSDVLKAIRRRSDEKAQGPRQYRNVFLDDRGLRMILGRAPAFGEVRDLLRLGHLTMRRISSSWTAQPRDNPRTPFPADEATVRAQLENVLQEIRGRGKPRRYEQVADEFVWVDASEQDVLQPVLDQLVQEGLVEWRQRGKLRQLEWVEAPPIKEPLPPPAEVLTKADFILLNTLEDQEARRINFGVFELWSTHAELARKTGEDRHEVADRLRRLQAHGHVMRPEGDDPLVRSRMAELAREVRYVKQRFSSGNIDQSPYLVRSLKLIARNREKPVRSHKVSALFEELRQMLSGVQHASGVLSAVEQVLVDAWGKEATVSGFQVRSLKTLLPAWFNLVDCDTAVITADTGSGKTEAACLPLIAGATIDLLKHQQDPRKSGDLGVRAVLVYPRIRLAANQAQRLTGYLAALADQPGMPLVTIGLQNGGVPTDWGWARKAEQRFERDPDERNRPLWHSVSPRRWKFPFFTCPRKGCDGALELMVGAMNTTADTLECCEEDCTWRFAGWVGTKTGLKNHPPQIFLPVTESLHQWMQVPGYAKIFGDFKSPGPPRAVLADEIHLYSLVPGAQVGYTLRRLLARMQQNAPDAPAPLAIGMSATLGDPARIWGDLVGRSRRRVKHIGPTPGEREENPVGREYFYFIQPEVESRGKDIAGTSTTIQSLMCLAHGTRRRTGKEGGFRGIVFLDSIDKLKRLHGDYQDAEENKRLATLRTRIHGTSAQSSANQNGCCGEPASCDWFREGECWYFAAKDEAQWTAKGRYRPGDALTVSSQPIFSKTRGNADRIVRESDIIFSTSSLEVGFDDPDMTLVYQHYAPVNLASFVQRKGRGGRGADDRPVTGVTLSVYSPRDSWFFRHPAQMLEAADFEVPLNVDNFFVRRGQVLSMLLDQAARYSALKGQSLTPQLPGAVFQTADEIVRKSFGPRVYEELETSGLPALWRDALEKSPDHKDLRSNKPRDWGKAIPWVPSKLFDPINLPVLEVVYPNPRRSKEPFGRASEDVSLGFAECAPGKMSRRWGFSLVHWNPYGGLTAAMLPRDGDVDYQSFSIKEGATPADMTTLLPQEALALMDGDAPPIRCVRPTRIPLQAAGEIWGSDWKPYWEYDPEKKQVRLIDHNRNDSRKLPQVHHKSNSRLLGSVVAVADPERVKHFAVPALAGVSQDGLSFYRSYRGKKRRTGLRVSQVFWGADLELVVEVPQGPVQKTRERVYLRQRFTHTRTQKPVLFGYGMETEGIAIHLDSAVLDAFVAHTEAELGKSPTEERWLKAQHFRYLIAKSASQIGLTHYQARQIADLLVAAAGDPDLRESFSNCIRSWDFTKFIELLKQTYEQLLSEHPVITLARVEALEEDLDSQKCKTAILEAMKGASSSEDFRGYLRSFVLHGLAIRLKQLFVLYGRGDERKVLFHAALPAQFGTNAHDRVTVCEKGSFGDGTTRTFLLRAQDAFGVWAKEGVVDCPNARADALLEHTFSQQTEHVRWRSWSPRDPMRMRQLARELGASLEDDAGAIQLVVRMLYNTEEIQGESFALYALYQEIRAIRAAIEARMVRRPSTWELVGAVVHAAVSGSPRAENWTRLLACYGGIDDIAAEGTLSAQARLADQIHRLSANLCPDGCQACLHTGSDLMDDGLATMTVSRRVLSAFWQFATHQTQPESSSDPTQPDFEWHDPVWNALLVELTEVLDGVVFDAGGDVVGEHGRVVGATFALIQVAETRLYLIDDRKPFADATAAALASSGAAAVRLEPSDGADPVLEALEVE